MVSKPDHRKIQVLPPGLLEDGSEGPDTSRFGLEDFLTFRAVELNRLIGRDSRRYLAEVSDLSLAEWRILAKTASMGGTTVNGIAAVTAFDKGQISRTVSSLVEKGLMEREVDAADSRSTILKHTQRGWALYEAILPHGRMQQRRLLKQLSPGQRAALYESMRILTEFLRGEFDEAGAPDDGKKEAAEAAPSAARRPKI